MSCRNLWKREVLTMLGLVLTELWSTSCSGMKWKMLKKIETYFWRVLIKNCLISSKPTNYWRKNYWDAILYFNQTTNIISYLSGTVWSSHFEWRQLVEHLYKYLYSDQLHRITINGWRWCCLSRPRRATVCK